MNVVIVIEEPEGLEQISMPVAMTGLLYEALRARLTAMKCQYLQPGPEVAVELI